MMKQYIFLVILLLFYSFNLSAQQMASVKDEAAKKYTITKSEEEWKKELTPEAYHVLREKGTEYAFTGKYYLNKKKGIYLCAACGNKLFGSEAKFDSNSGWPSFFKPLSKDHVNEIEDRTMGMIRTEVVCSRCGGHLGHVFPDGPKPTGLRYCINSVALDFQEIEDK